MFSYCIRVGAIKGEELSDVVCVVVRYFGTWIREDNLLLISCILFSQPESLTGGIKLGAGGLIRAYGAAARQVLREAPVDVLIPKATFRASVMSENVGSIYGSVAKAGAVTSGEEYGADGSLSVTITCDLQVSEQLKESLTDATRGSVQFLTNKED